jgi:drug/metabolite transporter (DMT)-like permease
MVVAAFATVYIVWGSTYFAIRLSVEHIPPMLVGLIRYLLAGILLLLWCLIRKERIFSWKTIKPAFVGGVLLLVGGNGALIWAEQYIPSGLAAILLASGPVWFVVLDKGKWKENFGNRATIIGLVIGFAGVLLLFGEKLREGFGAGAPANGATVQTASAAQATGAGAAHAASAGAATNWQAIALGVLVLGSISWAAGSLYSKYKSSGASNAVNAGWQMVSAGLVFLPLSLFSGEWSNFHPAAVPAASWQAVFYLVTMGSLVGYSAFVWLLKVRPATQVSTHAYVNPVVAVLLGVFFAHETLSVMQLLGLGVILFSVLLINLAKYRAAAAASKAVVL